MRPVDPDVEHPLAKPAAVEMIVEATDVPILNAEAAGVLALIVRGWVADRGNCHRGEQDSVA